MADSSNKVYSAADIVRYHTGGMSDSERHALEKAALDDPFLSDAVDGYVHTHTPIDDLHSLKQQLHRRSENVYSINRNRFLYLRIAAVAVLVAGFGWLALELFNTRSPEIAIQTEAAPQYKQAPTLQTQAADSVVNRTNKQSEGSDNSDVRETDGTTKKEVAKTTQAASGQDLQMESNAPYNASVPSNQTSFSKPHAADAARSNTENAVAAKRIPVRVFKARVVDVHDNAVPYATITNKQNAAIATTDTAGNFTVAMPDSNLSVAINSAGFQRRRLLLNKADSETKIILQPASEAIHKEVGPGSVAKMSSLEKVRLEGVEPTAGRIQFNRYIDEHMLVPDEIKRRAGSKEVVLSFDVDANGKAVNIQVERPLCVSCDSVAVRLIQESGKWRKIGKASKSKAHIRF